MVRAVQPTKENRGSQQWCLDVNQNQSDLIVEQRWTKVNHGRMKSVVVVIAIVSPRRSWCARVVESEKVASLAEGGEKGRVLSGVDCCGAGTPVQQRKNPRKSQAFEWIPSVRCCTRMQDMIKKRGTQRKDKRMADKMSAQRRVR